MKNDNTLLIGLGCVAAYFLFIKPKTTTATIPVAVVPGSGQSLPAYTVPSTGQSLVSQAGGALTNLINSLTGNAPNPANQIPVTNTPGSSTNINPPINSLPDNIPPVLPFFAPYTPATYAPGAPQQTAPQQTAPQQAPVLISQPVISYLAADNPSQYTVTYQTAAGYTAADYLGAQTDANGVTRAPGGTIINMDDSLYKMFQNGNYPGANKSIGAMREFVTQ